MFLTFLSIRNICKWQHLGFTLCTKSKWWKIPKRVSSLKRACFILSSKSHPWATTPSALCWTCFREERCLSDLWALSQITGWTMAETPRYVFSYSSEKFGGGKLSRCCETQQLMLLLLPVWKRKREGKKSRAYRESFWSVWSKGRQMTDRNRTWTLFICIISCSFTKVCVM